MAKTVNWVGSKGNYEGILNGHRLKIEKVPGVSKYDIYMDGEHIDWKYTVDNAKTRAIKAAENAGRGPIKAVIAEGEPVHEAKIYELPEPPAEIQIPMIPVADVPTFHVEMTFHYIGSTKEPHKLTEEIKKHVEAIRALGGEIDAEMSITSNTKIKL